MKIIYDSIKNTKNIELRNLSFDAVVKFEFETAMRWEDIRKNYGEQRYCALGIMNNRLHALVYTRIYDGIRVISFRKANKREVKLYEQHGDPNLE